jgi:hypothetical protein
MKFKIKSLDDREIKDLSPLLEKFEKLGYKFIISGKNYLIYRKVIGGGETITEITFDTKYNFAAKWSQQDGGLFEKDLFTKEELKLLDIFDWTIAASQLPELEQDVTDWVVMKDEI